MTNSESTKTEYQILIGKIDLINERLELYKQTSDRQLEAVKGENKAYHDSIRAEIKAYQDANKQQLNVSLGVLVTAAIALRALAKPIAILVSVVISAS